MELSTFSHYNGRLLAPVVRGTSCAARECPVSSNPEDAEEVGFRACKRCPRQFEQWRRLAAQTRWLSRSHATAPSETTAVFPAIAGEWNASAHYLKERHKHEYTFIKNGDTPVGGMMKHPMPAAPSIWLPHVGVGDIKAPTAKAKSLGAKVIVDVRPDERPD